MCRAPVGLQRLADRWATLSTDAGRSARSTIPVHRTAQTLVRSMKPERRHRLGIATAVVPHGEHATRTSFEAVLARTIDSFDPGLVVLAGFMRILTADFVGRYAGRLLNIHPSLLPAFPGLGTHERALATGCKVHGATVHFVTADLDHGPIVAQAVVPVLRGDDPVSLAARVLAQEHILYPRAIDWFARGLLRIENDLVRVTDPGVRQWIMA